MNSDSIDSGNGSEEYAAGVRLVVLNLPEDEGEGLGFRLTRTLWDPYPWVRVVTSGSRADLAGLRTGDCLLQADGKDLLGLPVGQVAGLIRGDGAGRGVSLLAWNCGVDPKDDPELLWSCGGGSRGERARRALGGAVRALACCVCAATAARPLVCARSHLYCEACWTRLERCALCRETLPAKDSPYARNLVAEQVFEAIATEYEIKDTIRRPRESVSACGSPAAARRGHYQVSMMNRKKALQPHERALTRERQNFGSDPSLDRAPNTREARRAPITTSDAAALQSGNTGCRCQNTAKPQVPIIRVSPAEGAPVRQASSLLDLQRVQPCLSRSLNSLDQCKPCTTSLESLKSCNGSCETPVFVIPPIYVVACDHKTD